MRYVLLLLTLLTAGFSVWYYQNRISPEGKELAAQKTTLEQEAAILEKAVIQSRKKLDDAQDATRAAEEDIERFQQAYLQQKRQQHQEIQDSAYQKSVADQQEEVKEHDQKIDRAAPPHEKAKGKHKIRQGGTAPEKGGNENPA